MLKKSKKILNKIIKLKNSEFDLSFKNYIFLFYNNIQIHKTNFDVLIKYYSKFNSDNFGFKKINILFISEGEIKPIINIIKLIFLLKKFDVNSLYIKNKNLKDYLKFKQKDIRKLKPDYIFIIPSSFELNFDFALNLKDKKKLHNINTNLFSYWKNIINYFNKFHNAKIYFFDYLKYDLNIFNVNINGTSVDKEIDKLNNNLKINRHFSVDTINLNILNKKYGTKNSYDLRLSSTFDLEIHPSNYKKVFEYIDHKISISLGNLKKVIILDLDNTLWKGVVADIGYNNIELGADTINGLSFMIFHKYLKFLKSIGIILAINSKNDLKNVKEAFKKNKHMVLQLSDFSSIQCNWDSKSDNIKKIKTELNLSEDSFIFIDDNNAECDLIRKYNPSVTVIKFDTPEETINLLEDNNYFNFENITKEDLIRSKTKIKTNNILSFNVNNQNNYDQFLKSLKMRSVIRKANTNDLDRLTQMELRTNQFNLISSRMPKNKINYFINKKINNVFTVSLEDRFDNHGIVSYFIISTVKNKLIIKNWLLSCRVFERTLEHRIINYILRSFKRKNYNKIIADYNPTKKNIVMLNNLLELGFNLNKDKLELLKIDKKFKTFIK